MRFMLLGVIMLVVAVLTGAGVGCALLTGAYACTEDVNCPGEQLCVSGSCTADGKGEGEEGEGEGEEGEGEGEGEGDEGEGEGGEGEGGEGEGGEGEGEGDEGEGEGEEPQCDTITGDRELSNQGDINQINGAIGGSACVNFVGTLTISGNFSNIPEIQEIATIDGSLIIDGTGGNFNELDDLPLLSVITGDFIIDNSELVDVVMPELVSVGSSVVITDNVLLQTLSLDALNQVGNNFTITDNVLLPCDDAESIANQLDNFNGSPSISGNLGCP